MSRDYNDDEIIEKVEADEDEKNEYNKEDRENGPEKFCFLCRRPENCQIIYIFVQIVCRRVLIL